MARYRAEIQGSRGAASRLGSQNSGIRAKVNGWDSGVAVYGGQDIATGRDIFDIYMTGGSNGQTPSRWIGQVVVNEDGEAELRAVGCTFVVGPFHP